MNLLMVLQGNVETSSLLNEKQFKKRTGLLREKRAKDSSLNQNIKSLGSMKPAIIPIKTTNTSPTTKAPGQITFHWSMKFIPTNQVIAVN